ncbi:DedA family protein [Entomobacter blattae]|uniref:Putative membrane protein n=1 Tax=Entomobacter blattae TaxID=2762277 RepID=A0A7H1NPU5_9PROT|nr:DedA family protein [Entomobacter blattae]QNT77805.1 putative membrane protein [Entomobacter blattae]
MNESFTDSTLFQHFDLLVAQYGYGLVGVVVMLESMGLPLPAESLLIATAIYCATTHKIQISFVVIAAIIGAIMGDNFGYLIGHHYGYPLLNKHGKKVGLTPKRLELGRFIFRKYGGKVIFFGRFVAFLRTFVALLAGASHMAWHSFLFYNALGGIAWAGGYSLGAYYLGKEIVKISGPLGIFIGVCVVIGIGFSIFFLKRNEARLSQEMEDEMMREKAK